MKHSKVKELDIERISFDKINTENIIAKNGTYLEKLSCTHNYIIRENSIEEAFRKRKALKSFSFEKSMFSIDFGRRLNEMVLGLHRKFTVLCDAKFYRLEFFQGPQVSISML